MIVIPRGELPVREPSGVETAINFVDSDDHPTPIATIGHTHHRPRDHGKERPIGAHPRALELNPVLLPTTGEGAPELLFCHE